MSRNLESDPQFFELTQRILGLKEALRQGKKINVTSEERYSSTPPLGDEVIEICTLYAPLEKFCAANGFSPPQLIYEKGVEKLGSNVHFLSITKIRYEIVYHPKPDRAARMNEGVFSKLLEIDVDFPFFSPLQKVPGHPFFNDFSRLKVEAISQAVIREHGSRIATVVQTGSEPVKRWSAEQVIEVYEHARTYFDRNNIRGVIISDAKLANDIQSIRNLTEYGLRNSVPVVFPEFHNGIELLAAYLGSTELLLSTDSAPGWIWCAEQSSKPDIVTTKRVPITNYFSRSRALIHHTITGPFWLVPGANSYYSDPVAELEDDLSTYGFLPGTGTTYARKYGINGALMAPAAEDLEGYLDHLKWFLSTL